MESFKVKHINGTARWGNKISPHNSNIYYTHDNGGRPFKVVIDSNLVKVYDNIKNNKLLSLESLQVFIGESPRTPMTEFSGGYGDDFKGNTILVEINDKEYVFIGDNIFTFKTNNKIINYTSEVGNNDVPYPYAIDSEDNFYLLIESIILKIPIQNRLDPYSYYYNRNKYHDILGIKYFIAYTDNGRVEYFPNYQQNPKEHYHLPWMKNLHILNYEGNEIPITEQEYVNMMDKITQEYNFQEIQKYNIIYS